MLLLCALIVGGASSVWAQTVAVDDVLWTEPFKGTNATSTFSATSSWGSYINPTTFVAADKTDLAYSSSNAMLSSTSATNMDGAHVWLNKNVDSYIQVTGIKLYNATKVEVSWAQATSGSSTTVYYQFDGEGDFTSLSTCSGPNAEFKSSELSVSDHTTIALKFAHPNSNNKNTRIDKLTLTVTEIAEAASTTAAPSISGNTPFLSNTTVTINNAASADGANIYYTLNGDDPTTTTSATCFAYSAPFTVDETTTVKAIAKHADDENASSVTSKTFTKVTPMTVTAALTAIAALANNGTIADQCVSGIVCTEGSLSSGAITYYISADGTESNRLQVYKGKGLNNASFENASDIAVGDEVVVYGTLKNFSGTTPEFDAGSFLLSKVRKPSPELAWSAASYTATYGGSISYPTLTNPNSVTVSYTSSVTNVATIDPSTGVITLKANGDTDITASFAGNATYRAQEVSYTLTVAGMKTTPGFSFAEAEVNMTYDEDYTGQVLTNPNSLTVTYESSDTDVADVDEDTGELALYKAGTVTITANYEGDATYASGSASYTINVTKASAGLAFASVGPFSVAPGADFDVPAFTNPHSLDIVWSSTDEDVAVAGATTAVIGSKLGTAVITASFAGDDCYNASEVSYTIIVTNDIEVTWNLSTNSYDDIENDDVVTWSNANVTMTNYSNGGTKATNYLGGDANNRTSSRFYKQNELTITPKNGFAIKSVIFTAASDSYATALANSSWTNATAVASSTTVTITPVDGTNDISAEIGATTGHTSVVVNLGKSFGTKFNSAGYATFAAPAPLDFSGASEYTAWQVTAANSSTGVITFSKITGKVAAGTGVLLKGTASSSINIPVTASGSDISGTNKLVGITSATAVSADTYYGLSGNVFKKVNAGTVPAGKALLPASEVSSARELTFVFEDSETTGISDASRLKDNGGMKNDYFFNLKGQRVAQPTKGGLYIVNGKKVVIK